MTRFFVDATGSYIGGFDGVEPPAGSVEIDVPPQHGWMVRDPVSSVWSMPPDKQALLDAMSTGVVL